MCFFSVSIACFTTALMSKLIQCTFLRQLHKFSRAHWLIFIVNKQTHEFIHVYLCVASTANLTICYRKKQIDVSFPRLCLAVHNEFR